MKQKHNFNTNATEFHKEQQSMIKSQLTRQMLTMKKNNSITPNLTLKHSQMENPASAFIQAAATYPGEKPRKVPISTSLEESATLT